jgi:hypothetical protein
VELFLNDESLGKKEINANASPRVWRVGFAPGILKAVASNGGKAVATLELRTAGAAAEIRLETRSRELGVSWDDVAIVRSITDSVEATSELMKCMDDTLVYHTSNEKVILEVRTRPGLRGAI